MTKMYIELDENLIKKDNEYEILDVYNYINKLFNDLKMKNDGNGWYSKGNHEDLAYAYIILSDQEWFMKYIKTWMWYDETDDSYESMLPYEED